MLYIGDPIQGDLVQATNYQHILGYDFIIIYVGDAR